MTVRGLLRACIRKAGWRLGLSMVSSFIRQIAFLALPYLLGRAVQDTINAGNTDALPRHLAVLAVIVAVEFVGFTGWVWWANIAEARLAEDLRVSLLDAVLAAEPEPVDATSARYGDLLARAVEDVDNILIWVHGLATWIVITTTVVVLVPAFFGIDPLMLAVALGCAAVLAVINLTVPPRFSRRMGVFVRAQAARTQSVEELLAAQVTLRGVGGEQVLVERHRDSSSYVTVGIRNVARIQSLWTSSADAVPFLGIALGLTFGGLAAVDGRIDVGELTTFALWMGTVQLATNAIVARLGDLGTARVSAGRIVEVLQQRHVPRTTTSAAEPSGAPVLDLTDLQVTRVDPITLTLRPGEWGLISGRTGSGKSTLLRAVAGLIEHEGSVSWRGRPRQEWPGETWFDQATLVPQAPLLFHGTIRDNLMLAAGPTSAPDPTDEALTHACWVAGFDEVLATLPEGLDTVVGERGSTLSGGQRQRLALARAILRDAPILLLDDVTSALDPDTEAVVLDRLRVATADRVVLWAGHRPALTSRVDSAIELTGARHG